MAIAHDGQQPRLGIGAPQSIETSKSAQNSILHHVVGIAGAAQPPSEPIRSVEMRQNLPLESSALVIHRVKTHAEAILFPFHEYSRLIGYPWRPNNRGIAVIRTLAAVGVGFLWVIQSSAAWAQHPFLSDADWSNLRHE